MLVQKGAGICCSAGSSAHWACQNLASLSVPSPGGRQRHFNQLSWFSSGQFRN